MSDSPRIADPLSTASCLLRRVVGPVRLAALVGLCLLLGGSAGCGPGTAGTVADSKEGKAALTAGREAPLAADGVGGNFQLRIEPEVEAPGKVSIWLSAEGVDLSSCLPALDDPRWSLWLSLRLVEPRAGSTSAPASDDGADLETGPGMAGTFARVGDRIRFQPRFALLPGATYRARFAPPPQPASNAGARSHAAISVDYVVPRDATAVAPQVIGFYPTAAELPANQLKFYIQFSEPMQGGNVWEHFELRDEMSAAPVPSPFRHTELWSEDRRQLTLWFHPGRQKTGVNLNVEIGSVLTAGRRYTLTISPDWMSDRSVPLGTPIQKSFTAIAADHAQPNLQDWIVQSPGASTRDALRVHFPESLDFALLNSQVWVTDAAGRRLNGRVQIGYGERDWSFVPDSPWQAGDYLLTAAHVLEDLAGNSLGRPFEVDLENPVATATRAHHTRPFKVTSATASTSGVNPRSTISSSATNSNGNLSESTITQGNMP